MRNTKLAADKRRIFFILIGAATLAARFSVARITVKPHGHADTIISGLFHQQSSNRAVYSSAHSYHSTLHTFPLYKR